MILIGCVFSALMYAQAQPSTDWKRYEETWKKFLDNPANATLQSFYDILPESGKIFVEGDGVKIVEQITSGIDVLLYHLVSTNDILVAKTAFRLFAFAPSHDDTPPTETKKSKEPINIAVLAEKITPLEKNLYKLMGKYFTMETSAFLKELILNRQFVPSLEILVGSFMINPTGDASALQMEKKSRINILQNIDDKSLDAIRSECLNLLKRVN